MNTSKKQFYADLQQQLGALLEGESDLIANLANTSALIFEKLENINWAGFYLLKQNELVLGPFQGKPACVRIQIGKGVCGTAVEKKHTIVVSDVHQFEGHIACDINSKSEIVVPVIVSNQLLGVLDIDSPIENRFDLDDQSGLEALVQQLQTALAHR